jgi:hypothetical protein
MSRPIDLYAEITALNAFTSAAVSGSTAVNGSDVNYAAGLNEGGVVLIQTGAATGAPSAFSLAYKLQTAPDSNPAAPTGSPGTYADLKDGFGNLQNVTVTAAGITKLRFEGQTASKFVRLVVTPTFVGGTGPASPVAAVIVLASGKYGGQL